MNNNVRKSLANNIKEERIKKRWSQTKLAELVNVNSASTIGNWESGIAAPDCEKLSFLADIFQVSTDYLLGRVDNTELYVDETETSTEKIKSAERNKKYYCCDEIGQSSIDNCIDFHYKRCVEIPNGVRTKENGKAGVEAIFLVQGKDKDYDEIKNRIPYLKALKKNSKRSFGEITRYLWDLGYGDEICLAFILDIFGVGANKRVPSQTLYNQIEAFLRDDFVVTPILKKKK